MSLKFYLIFIGNCDKHIFFVKIVIQNINIISKHYDNIKNNCFHESLICRASN